MKSVVYIVAKKSLEEQLVLEQPGALMEHFEDIRKCSTDSDTITPVTDMELQQSSSAGAVYCKLNGYLAGCIIYTCKRSSTFQKNFLEYANSKWKRIHIPSRQNGQPAIFVLHIVSSCRDIIDYKWNYQILELVAKKVVLDEAMNWLNTLGGGYSALGDYFVEHAAEAGRTSMKQLRIALDMGDPPTVIRCKLYWSISLMQQGQIRKAKQIIRHEYDTAQHLPVRDVRLEAMCHGIWSRLKYLRSKQKQNIQNPSL